MSLLDIVRQAAESFPDIEVEDVNTNDAKAAAKDQFLVVILVSGQRRTLHLPLTGIEGRSNEEVRTFFVDAFELIE